MRDSGETPGRAFQQLPRDDKDKKSPLRASKKRAEAGYPRAALGTGPGFLVPREGGVGRGREAQALGAAFLARVRDSSAWTRHSNGQEPLLEQAPECCCPPPRLLWRSSPLPSGSSLAHSSLPNLFLLGTLTATQLREDSLRWCWALEKPRPRGRRGPAFRGQPGGRRDWPRC